MPPLLHRALRLLCVAFDLSGANLGLSPHSPFHGFGKAVEPNDVDLSVTEER